MAYCWVGRMKIAISVCSVERISFIERSFCMCSGRSTSTNRLARIVVPRAVPKPEMIEISGATTDVRKARNIIVRPISVPSSPNCGSTSTTVQTSFIPRWDNSV